jgi:hypothetical protein
MVTAPAVFRVATKRSKVVSPLVVGTDLGGRPLVGDADMADAIGGGSAEAVKQGVEIEQVPAP